MRKTSGFKLVKWGLYFIFIGGIAYYIIISFVFKISGFWQELVFSISLAGLIGIGTNTIAIEMLFHPVEKTFFGRQGLLPANKEKIAESLAKTVRERIINEETISEYLNNENKIKEISDKIVLFLKNWIKKAENQKRIRELLESALKSEVKDRFFKEAENFLEELLVKYLSSENLRFTEIFRKVRSFFRQRRQIKDPILEKAISLIKEIINELISENSDKIAKLINSTIDDFINSKGWFANLVLTIGRDILVSEGSVRKFVMESLNDESKIGKIGDLAEEILPDLDRILNKPHHRENLAEIYELGKTRIFVYLKDKELKKLIFLIRDKLEKILRNNKEFENFFEKINSFIVLSLEKIVESLKGYSDKGKIRELLIKSDIGGSVYRLVKTNILKQDMEEFEKMMKKIMGDNLAYIEVVGGMLGGFIGLGLFYKPALLILPIGLGAFLLIECVLTKTIKKGSGL